MNEKSVKFKKLLKDNDYIREMNLQISQAVILLESEKKAQAEDSSQFERVTLEEDLIIDCKVNALIDYLSDKIFFLDEQRLTVVKTKDGYEHFDSDEGRSANARFYSFAEELIVSIDDVIQRKNDVGRIRYAVPKTKRKAEVEKVITKLSAFQTSDVIQDTRFCLVKGRIFEKPFFEVTSEELKEIDGSDLLGTVPSKFVKWNLHNTWDVRNTLTVPVEIDQLIGSLANKDEETKQSMLTLAATIFMNDSALKSNYGRMLSMTGHSGGNGKSKYIDLLKMIVGEELTAEVNLKSISSSSTYLAASSLLTAIGDKGSEKLDSSTTEIFKHLIFNEIMQIKLLYSDPFNYRPISSMIMASNFDLKTSVPDPGFNRRIVILQCENKLNDQLIKLCKIKDLDAWHKRIYSKENIDQFRTIIIDRCQKIISGEIEFLPESSMMLEQKAEYLEMNDSTLLFIKAYEHQLKIGIPSQFIDAAKEVWAKQNSVHAKYEQFEQTVKAELNVVKKKAKLNEERINAALEMALDLNLDLDEFESGAFRYLSEAKHAFERKSLGVEIDSDFKYTDKSIMCFIKNK